MRAAASIDDFMRAPVGRYVAGRSFLVWCAAPDCIGNVYFGRPDDADLEAIARTYDLPRHPNLSPAYDVVQDCSRLTAVDVAAHRTFIAYAATRLPDLVPLVRRLAIVRPHDLAGTVIAGLFHEVIRRTMPCQLFAHPKEAFAWLGRPDGPAIHAAVEAATGHACASLAPHQRLRALLADDPQIALRDAARALGMSDRSLQRGLHEAGTSFRAERRRARIAEAKTLLTETDDKLHAVAGRVGCPSLPQFGRLFRRATGETPGAFRERQRR